MTDDCWQITFCPQKAPSSDFIDFLDEYFSAYTQNYADDGNDEFIGYYEDVFDEKSMLNSAQNRHIELPPYQIEHLQSSNWLKDYAVDFAPYTIGDFMIYGINETNIPPTAKIPLKIYAATAFGSDHPTTRCCLNAICQLHNQGFNPRRILDIGTGSGILSLAAAALWPHAQITAVDIDAESVIVTQTNANNNHLEQQLTIALSDGFNNPIVKTNAPYDLVLANILARPLLDMAPDIYLNSAPDGQVLISGFVTEQTDWILSAYQHQGYTSKSNYQIENWHAFLMQKL